MRLGRNSAPTPAARTTKSASSTGGLGPRALALSERLWAPGRRTKVLLIYGALAAVLSGFYLWSHLPSADELPIQSSRVQNMAASTYLMDQEGAPPLLKRTPEAPPGQPSFTGYPSYDSLLNGGDDTGVYAYVPVLALWLDIDVHQALKLLLLLFLIPVLLYPLAFYRLTGSALAAFASPVLLVAAVLQHEMYFDLYWIQAWAVLALLPLILLAWQRRDRSGLAILAGVMPAAAFASTVRGGAGVGIALAAVAVVALAFRGWSKLRRAGAIAGLVALYLAISPGAMTLLEHKAVSWAGDNLYEKQVEGNNSFFHIAFIGLGYQPNDWSIYYRDGIANAFAKQEDPDAVYLSSEYNATLRGLFFDRVREDPGFFASLIGKKLAVSLVDIGLGTLLFVLLAVRLMCVTGPDRKLMRTALLVALPSFVIGILPGLLAIPQPQYVLGSTAVFAFLEIVVWMLVLVMVGRWAAPRVREALSAARPGSAAPMAVGAGVIAAAAVFLVGLDLIRLTAVGLLLLAAILSLLAPGRLRAWRIASLSRSAIGVGASVATLVVVASALPARDAANAATDRFFIWDTNQQAIEQAIASTLPASEPNVDLPPAGRP